VLAGITPCTLPKLAEDLDAFLIHLRDPDGEDLGMEERHKQASTLLGIALAVTLCRNAWELRVLPGEDAVCERDGTCIKPFDIVPKLASGELTGEAWQEFCTRAGIAGLDFGGVFMPQEAWSH
jgi:hypothetical protein